MGDYILIKKYNYTIIPWLPILIFSLNRRLTDQQLVSQFSTRVTRRRGTRKDISLSMTVYTKYLSSQYNLTAQKTRAL